MWSGRCGALLRRTYPTSTPATWCLANPKIGEGGDDLAQDCGAAAAAVITLVAPVFQGMTRCPVMTYASSVNLSSLAGPRMVTGGPDCPRGRGGGESSEAGDGEHAAASVRAYAADQRVKVDVLASVLEDIAANGYPSPETGVPWETARDARLARLTDEQARVA